MNVLWISDRFMHRFTRWAEHTADRTLARSTLRAVLSHIYQYGGQLESSPGYSTGIHSPMEWKGSRLDRLDCTLLIDFALEGIKRYEIKNTPFRALLIPEDALGEMVEEDAFWDGICDGLQDAANIDATRQLAGKKFKAVGILSSIFISGDHHRLHMVDFPKEGFLTVLGIHSAETWTRHKYAEGIPQPSTPQVDAWRKSHERAQERRALLETAIKWRADTLPVEELPELRDTWATLGQLRDWGIVDPKHMAKVLQCTCKADLQALIGVLLDVQWDRVEHQFSQYQTRLARHEERAAGGFVSTVLSLPTRQRADVRIYDDWLPLLTPAQRKVVTVEMDRPIRLKGGPGTGKTLTAILRAGYLLRLKAENGEPFRLGFMVFNRDIGKRVAERFVELGFGDHLAEDAKQKLVVTNLLDWCKAFIDLDSLNVEVLEPFRDDRSDETREEMLQLTIEQARARLIGEDYSRLWAEFDARSRNGLNEIQVEISQFIKANAIRDLTTYLNRSRRSSLGVTEKAFRQFVWEVVQIYDETLAKLGYIDADDLVNDCFREVDKHVWKQFKRATQGFDYLIIDEGQDFFPNQLHLVAALVDDPSRLMICFDQGQMVYSRYPTLRDMGWDTEERFWIERLRTNFRNSRAVIAALNALVSKYHMYDYLSLWGEIEPGTASPGGPRPDVRGFVTNTGMFDEMLNLVSHYRAELKVEPREVAVIGFDEDLLANAAKHLENHGHRVRHSTARGKQGPRGAITVSTARGVKGDQFEACILLGVDRDRLPDLRGLNNPMQAEMKRADDFRAIAVAVSRCKKYLHFLYFGTEPSEFVKALDGAVDFRGA